MKRLPMMIVIAALLGLALLAGCQSQAPAPAASATPAPAATAPVAEPPTAEPTAKPQSEPVAAAWQPLGALDCLANRILLSNILGVEAELSPARFFDYIGETEGAGCLVTADVPLDSFGSHPEVIAAVQSELEAQGWTENPAYIADGSNTTLTAFNNSDGSLLCLLEATRDEENGLYHVLYNCAVDSAQVAQPEAVAGPYTPLEPEACSALQQMVSDVLGVQATLAEGVPFVDFGTDEGGTACETHLEATGEQLGLSNQVDIAAQIAQQLVNAGWEASPERVADGPTATLQGYTRDGQLALLDVAWAPTYGAAPGCTETFVLACDFAPAEQQFTVTLQAAQQ